jgi:hypothetical protein
MTVYAPLDVPYVHCDSDNIKRYMDKRSSRTDYSWTEGIDQPWNHVIIRSPRVPTLDTEIPGSGWRPDFKRQFPEVVAAVEQLPYNSIAYVYLFEQVIPVKPHFDHVGKNENTHLEPASYRITLLMEDTEAFYICDDETCTTYSHPRYPSDTNTWAFSNETRPHGSLLPKLGTRKILLIIGGGVLDEDKHFELLKRSYAKYSEYIIE